MKRFRSRKEQGLRPQAGRSASDLSGMAREKQSDTSQDDPGRKAQFGLIAAWTEPKPPAPAREAPPRKERPEPDETEAA